MNDQNLIVRVKITLHDGTSDETHAPAFGRGVARLCELVDETGSLNKAAKSMGMAYSKAWRLIKQTEDVLDCQLLERNGPKGSFLTDEGKRLVGIYRQVEDEARRASNQMLRDILSSDGE